MINKVLVTLTNRDNAPKHLAPRLYCRDVPSPIEQPEPMSASESAPFKIVFATLLVSQLRSPLRSALVVLLVSSEGNLKSR